MSISWPDLKIPPLNLWVLGPDHRLFIEVCKKDNCEHLLEKKPEKQQKSNN